MKFSCHSVQKRPVPCILLKVYRKEMNKPVMLALNGDPLMWYGPAYLIVMTYSPGTWGMYLTEYPSSTSLQSIVTLEGPSTVTCRVPLPALHVFTTNSHGLPENNT